MRPSAHARGPLELTAFNQVKLYLAQKVSTRSAHAAVSKVCADAVLKKVLNVRRKKAGEFLKDVRAINAIKLEDSVAYMKHIVLYHWSLCACIVIGCVIRVYIGSCVATSQS